MAAEEWPSKDARERELGSWEGKESLLYTAGVSTPEKQDDDGIDPGRVDAPLPTIAAFLLAVEREPIVADVLDLNVCM